MRWPEGPRVLAVPATQPLLAWLAGFLIDLAAGDPLAMARSIVLLPGRRAVQGLRDAMVRRAEPALLLPRILAVGDVADAGDVEPDLARVSQPILDRGAARLRLAGILRQGSGSLRGALVEAEAMLGAISELAAWDRTPDDVRRLDVEAELAAHWARTSRRFAVVAGAWPELLAELDMRDPACASVDAMRAMARQLQAGASRSGVVVAAGFAAATPALAELLGVVARLPRGWVVCPGLDLAMPAPEWDAIDPLGQHPQAPLRHLLDLMHVARDEVDEVSPGAPAPLLRSVAPGAMYRRVAAPDGAFACVEAANPEEEAAVIALSMRAVLEREAGTVALVTPDRTLARRVRARLARWGLRVDDSAGEPLGHTPAGALARLALAAAADGLAPLSVVSLLEHPLVRAGDDRLQWLDQLRALELEARRHPQPASIGALDALAAGMTGNIPTWWAQRRAELAPLAEPQCTSVPAAMAALAAVLDALGGAAFWAEADGRALAALIDLLASHGQPLGWPGWRGLLDLFDQLALEMPVRPPAGVGHPRLAIRGLIEARLGDADLVILGGLNDGVWPSPGAPDLFLPPLVRTRLGLPDARRQLAVAAHDFGLLLASADEVLLTRALRDGQAPSVASSFWVRLDASGLLRPDADRLSWARALDQDGAPPRPMARPQPSPPLALRPRHISAARADTLRSDPFHLFASDVLGLRRLPALGEAPGPRERGIAIHAALEDWLKGGEVRETLAGWLGQHAARWIREPVVLALWRPRLEQIARWVEEQTARRREAGWKCAGVEASWSMPLLAGIELRGRADWVEQDQGGELAIIDFKTGAPPSARAMLAGFGVQLGLLGALAGSAGPDRHGDVRELLYWKLSGGDAKPGEIKDVLRTRSGGTAAARAWSSAPEFIAFCLAQTIETARRYLVEGEPFLARARPEFARSGDDFDHLARTEEWLAELYGER